MQTDLAEQMIERGFAVIDYPRHITDFVSIELLQWQRFCALPLKTKSLFTYSGDTGSGYEYKDERGRTRDRKENFHITIEELHRLLDIANPLLIIDKDFLIWGQLLLAALEPPIFEFARQIECRLGFFDLAQEISLGWRQWFLRLLHYFSGQKARSVIAASHCDKAGLTVYLGETTSGVQYRTFDNKRWIDMPVEEGKMIVTANMQMQLKTSGKIKALHHRVVANRVSELAGRNSMVCFIPFVNTPQYDKARWGRLQDMPVGFNYNMPHKQFQKYFK